MSESKLSAEDNQYLERTGVCEATESLLQLACQTKATEPSMAFLTAIVEQNCGAVIRRVQPDVAREDKLTKSKAWRDLETAAYSNVSHKLNLFQGSRADGYSTKLVFKNDANNGEEGEEKQNFLYYDYSKTNMSDATRTALLGVATHCKLTAAIDKMKTGEKIN